MSHATPLLVSRLAARCFARRALYLDTSLPDIDAALAYFGYIQIDPLNICGRMHDLILRNRVGGYREGDLMRHLHGGEDGRAIARPLAASARTAFEHHVPGTNILVAFPLEAWPHLIGAMHRRSRTRGAWAGRLTPREEALAEKILSEIAARGPLSSDDFDDPRQGRRVWGAARLAKATLQKLFFHGRVLIAQRPHHRRKYDLPERVLPARVLRQPEPSAHDTARWLAQLKLRQRRLATLTREEATLIADLIQPVTLADLPPGVKCPPLYCLRADAYLLEATASGLSALDSQLSARIALLAPLDPLIYDRRVTAALWDFDYTWEAYTPPHKRVRGHYSLPILAGTEIIGHVDPKADRAARKLQVAGRSVRRGHAVAPALSELAEWLGLG